MFSFFLVFGIMLSEKIFSTWFKWSYFEKLLDFWILNSKLIEYDWIDLKFCVTNESTSYIPSLVITNTVFCVCLVEDCYRLITSRTKVFIMIALRSDQMAKSHYKLITGCTKIWELLTPWSDPGEKVHHNLFIVRMGSGFWTEYSCSIPKILKV